MSNQHYEIVFVAWSCRLSHSTLDFLWSVWSWHVLDKLSINLDQVLVISHKVPFKGDPYVPASSWMHKSHWLIHKIPVVRILFQILLIFLSLHELLSTRSEWEGNGPNTQAIVSIKIWVISSFAQIKHFWLPTSLPKQVCRLFRRRQPHRPSLDHPAYLRVWC